MPLCHRIRPARRAGLATCCLLLAGCSGPPLGQRLGVAPETDVGPWRPRLAAYRLDPTLPSPDDPTRATQAPPAAGNTARETAPRAAAQRSSAPRANGTRAPRTQRGGRVDLEPHELAQVHDWLGRDRAQWILGDVVDVVVSKEFFSQVLTVNAYSGAVRREDRVAGDDALILLEYLGAEGSEHALVTPRIQIGPGLAVTARRSLRLRLAKTEDASRPVRLRILATGGARRGRGETVTHRSDVLELRGDLVYDSRAAGWGWRATP